MGRAKRRWCWILVGLLALAPTSGCAATVSQKLLEPARMDPCTEGVFITVPLLLFVDLPLSPVELLFAFLCSGCRVWVDDTGPTRPDRESKTTPRVARPATTTSPRSASPRV